MQDYLLLLVVMVNHVVLTDIMQAVVEVVSHQPCQQVELEEKVVVEMQDNQELIQHIQDKLVLQTQAVAVVETKFVHLEMVKMVVAV